MSVSACKPCFTLPSQIAHHFDLVIDQDSVLNEAEGYYRLLLTGNIGPTEAQIIEKIKEYFNEHLYGEVAFWAEQPHSVAALTDADGYICNVTVIAHQPCKIIVTIVHQR